MNTVLSIFLISTLFYVTIADDFKVRSHPTFLSLAKNDGKPYHASTLTNNLLVLLGLSPEKSTESDRPLFYSTDPWNSPKSTWIFHVEGVDQLSKSGYPLVQGESFNINQIQSKLRGVHDSHGVATENIHLTPEFDLKQLQETLKSKVDSLDSDAKVKYIGIVCEICQNKDVLIEIKKSINTVGKSIVNVDPETLIITIGTKENVHVRHVRQVSNNPTNVTIADMYSDNYPVMFNLFFWSSLVLAVIITCIVYVFLTLDPGSDTIIYRMTTPRLKVD